jgi:hypothetical protein
MNQVIRAVILTSRAPRSPARQPWIRSRQPAGRVVSTSGSTLSGSTSSGSTLSGSTGSGSVSSSSRLRLPSSEPAGF